MKNHYYLITVLIALSTSLPAQNFTGGFNFYLPPQDTARSAYLPSFPAKAITDQDVVSIDADGHFSVRGNRIRFFGTNFVADGAFPVKTKAWYAAGRLRKMGFNLVRLHHLDNAWSVQSLFEWGSDTRHLNLVTLDKLENLIAEFKKNGIYVDVNLHVSRTFNAMDGVANYDSLPEMGKLVNYFDPQILLLHKEYAKQLLTHINPYTEKPLRNDPVMAWVELTNENSLYRGWHDNQIKSHADGGMLPYRHVRMLDSLWIAYLKSKYPSTDSLQSAWNIGSGIGQNTDKVRDGGFETPVSLNWKIENDGTGSASMENDSVNAYQGKYSGKLIVHQADGVDWHLQFKQVGLSITKDSVYRIAFSARADSTRTISVSVIKETSPYT